MEWKIVQRDFVERTLKILQQYDDYARTQRGTAKGYEELEVTLLVNCLTGLLVVPYEYVNRDKQPGSVPVCKGDTAAIKDLSDDWGLRDIQIERICDFAHKPVEPPTDANLRMFVYRIRNSIAHTRFQDGGRNIADGVGIIYQTALYDPNRSRIEKLTFQDKDNRFKAILPVESLRKFAEKFAKAVLGNA